MSEDNRYQVLNQVKNQPTKPTRKYMPVSTLGTNCYFNNQPTYTHLATHDSTLGTNYCYSPESPPKPCYIIYKQKSTSVVILVLCFPENVIITTATGFISVLGFLVQIGGNMMKLRKGTTVMYCQVGVGWLIIDSGK